MRKLLKILRAGWRFVSDVYTIASIIGLTGISFVGFFTPVWSFAAGHTGPEIFILTVAAIALVLFVGIVGFGLISDLLGRRAVYLSRLVAEGRGLLARLNGAGSSFEFNLIFDVDYEHWTKRTIRFLTDEYNEAVATGWDGISPYSIRSFSKADPDQNRKMTEVAIHVEKLDDILTRELER